MTFSVDAGKVCDKIEHPFMKNTFNKLGTHLSVIKVINNKPRAAIILRGERLKALAQRSGIRQQYPHSPLLINVVLEVQTNKRSPSQKERKKIVFVCR